VRNFVVDTCKSHICKHKFTPKFHVPCLFKEVTSADKMLNSLSDRIIRRERILPSASLLHVNSLRSSIVTLSLPKNEKLTSIFFDFATFLHFFPFFGDLVFLGFLVFLELLLLPFPEIVLGAGDPDGDEVTVGSELGDRDVVGEFEIDGSELGDLLFLAFLVFLEPLPFPEIVLGAGDPDGDEVTVGTELGDRDVVGEFEIDGSELGNLLFLLFLEPLPFPEIVLDTGDPDGDEVTVGTELGDRDVVGEFETDGSELGDSDEDGVEVRVGIKLGMLDGLVDELPDSFLSRTSVGLVPGLKPGDGPGALVPHTSQEAGQFSTTLTPS
jgi:hypothetical protein